MGIITACIPKGLRCITTRALVKGRSGNKVPELVSFQIVRAVRKWIILMGNM